MLQPGAVPELAEVPWSSGWMEGSRNLGREALLFTCTIEASLGAKQQIALLLRSCWTITPMGGEPCTNHINALALMLDVLHNHNQTNVSMQNNLLSNANST